MLQWSDEACSVVSGWSTGGRLWMEMPVFNLLDGENKSRGEWWRRGREGGREELELDGAREVRERS